MKYKAILLVRVKTKHDRNPDKEILKKLLLTYYGKTLL